MRRQHILLFVLASSPSFLHAEERTLFKFQESHLGRDIEISVYAWNEVHAEEAAQAAFRRVAELEAAFSAEKPDSELSRLNRAKPGVWIPLSDDLFEVLERALRVAEISGGLYDPVRPPAGEREGTPDWKTLHLREEDHGVLFDRAGTRLDLGEPVLGYIGDEVRETLAEKFVTAALCRAGDQVVVRGAPPDSAGWLVEGLGGGDESERATLLKDQALSMGGGAGVLAPRGLTAAILAQAVTRMGLNQAKTLVPLFPGCRLWDPDRDEINWWNRVSRTLPAARASFWMWALGLVFFDAAWVSRRRRNLIRDLPPSRPRSVAMGLVEVVGKAATGGEPVPGPAGGAACVWSKTLRTRYAESGREGGGESWVEEDRRPFRLVDGKGSVRVDPRGARIYGKKIIDERDDFNRTRVWTIEEGEEVFVLGEAVPSQASALSRAEKVKKLLKFWTETPSLREKIDVNADGILQPEEWDRARAHAEDHVTRDSLSEPGVQAETVLRAPRHGYFFISTRGEKNALALQGQPWLRLLLGLGAAYAGWALWPGEFGEILARRTLRGVAEAWPILTVLFFYQLHVRGFFHQGSGSAFTEYHG